eukprot:CAMPEP_0170542236 /NCGR_PEP_ID=MMETSP0211-20121228/1726_1 /TAXON_ID=311385 /ORGANISM="Pseudokeronopsis sp., Strain OXSARD2" /LENGTH=70 /DNA_ID=CAMNT_0010845231 /DNA_START=170 /DNA_END=382 /DNA_ORIENTATION=-
MEEMAAMTEMYMTEMAVTLFVLLNPDGFATVEVPMRLTHAMRYVGISMILGQGHVKMEFLEEEAVMIIVT